MKKRDKIIIAALSLGLVAAGIFTVCFMTLSPSRKAENEVTVKGSILSDVPISVNVAEPEREPVEEMDPELEESIPKAEEKDLSEEAGSKKKVDLIVFAGQSNMSGYGGNAEESPEIGEGAGAEFRAVSDPETLYTVAEPFGIYENTEIMNDFYLKKGSLVTSFINTWYEETGTPVVAVSASKGGTPSTYWASDAVCAEVEGRFKRAKKWLTDNGYEIGNQFLVFLQGENDVLENIPDEQYLTDINVFSTRMFYAGIDKFLMIRIGREKGKLDSFNRIADLQTELCRTDPRFVLVSTLLSGVGDDHMTDTYHYDQAALNLLGTEAAVNGAYFAINRRDPEIMDYMTGTRFIPVDYGGKL